MINAQTLPNIMQTFKLTPKEVHRLKICSEMSKEDDTTSFTIQELQIKESKALELAKSGYLIPFGFTSGLRTYRVA